MPTYVVLQVVLKEKLIGTGSGNLPELEKVINEQAAKGIVCIRLQQRLLEARAFWAATGFRQLWYLKACKRTVCDWIKLRAMRYICSQLF